MLNFLKEATPSFGVFIAKKRGFSYLSGDSKNLLLKFSLADTQNDNSRILQLKVKNISHKKISINSLVVAEFYLSNFQPEEILENGWQSTSFCGYKNRLLPTKKKTLFLTRDQNPYSFKREFGYLKNSIVNEWFTQIVGKSNSLIIGAITCTEQFSQIFLRKEGNGLRIRITCQFDGLELEPGKIFTSEKIALVFGNKDNSLNIFANLLKKFNKINILKKPPKGLCCAYYFQGDFVDGKYIHKQLKLIKKLTKKVRLDHLLIDSGYSPWGDWLDSKKNFPYGMELIVKKIKKRGLKAGIWIAPFTASPKSFLFKKHPEWFLKNAKGKYIEALAYSPFDFLPHLSLRVIDPTHSQFQKHLSKIIKKFVLWGFELIKIDFTYPVCFAHKYYLPITRAKALRIGLETIRQAAGEKTHILSAISPLSPLVGIADSVRVGTDTIYPYICKIPVINKIVNQFLLKENLRNCEVRQFLNGKIWINDADCLVFRKETGLTNILINRHLKFVSDYGGSVWLGDCLRFLPEKALIKLLGYK